MGFHNTRLVGPWVRPPCDLSHQSASRCTYCSHSRSNEARLNELRSNWVMTSVGVGGLVVVGPRGGQQRPVMSLCVRAVISSRCKCIPVQVGPLIYSSEGIFINLSLISPSTRCKKKLCRDWWGVEGVGSFTRY